MLLQLECGSIAGRFHGSLRSSRWLDTPVAGTSFVSRGMSGNCLGDRAQTLLVAEICASIRAAKRWLHLLQWTELRFAEDQRIGDRT